jgi:hypothetical protein
VDDPWFVAMPRISRAWSLDQMFASGLAIKQRARLPIALSFREIPPE